MKHRASCIEESVGNVPFDAVVKKKPRFWAGLIIGIVIVWCLVARVAATWLVVSAPRPQADALLQLSGSSAYIERARLTAQLFREGRASLVILTNDGEQGSWVEAEQRNLFFYERTRDALINLGVPSSSIVVLPQQVSSTYDEAVLARQYSQDRNLRSLLIVTSAHHSRRALWTFRHIFAGTQTEIGLLSIPEGGSSEVGPTTWWLHYSGWRDVAMEYPKQAYYWLRY